MSAAGQTDLKSGNCDQLTIATTGFNRWVTGVALGHDPSDEECVWHFIENGGAEAFRQEHQCTDTSSG